MRAGRIARQIARWAPDVVALSEFRATPPSLALAGALARQGLSHQLTTANPERVGVNALAGGRAPSAAAALGCAPRRGSRAAGSSPRWMALPRS